MPATVSSQQAIRHPGRGFVRSDLEQRIHRAAAQLPIIRPITSFVTQNPLHAFEHLPFEEGVIEGARLFGAHPYLSEDAYREKLARGRIKVDDLEAILRGDLGDRADERLLGVTRLSLRLAMLRSPIRVAPVAELRWLVAESDALRKFREEVDPPLRAGMIAETRHWIMRDIRPRAAQADGVPNGIQAVIGDQFETITSPGVERWSDAEWESFVLRVLWRACLHGTRLIRPGGPAVPVAVRHRDLLLDCCGADSDRLVNDVLIPFCAAYVDQGFANVPLPDRDRGFYESFMGLYCRSTGPAQRWMGDVCRELERLRDTHTSPLESIQESLEVLGVSDAETDAFLAATCAALRGWTGLIWQAESQPGLTVRDLPAGSLVGLLAVRLILERSTLKHIAWEHLDYRGPLASLRDIHRNDRAKSDLASLESRAFQLFQVAQLVGWQPEELIRLQRDDWAILLGEIEGFSSLDRRRVHHLAFERRYRHRALDAISVRSSLPVRPRVRPRFQTVSCMDDREESFRRWLEELCPSVETMAMAGFFGVVMRYRGAAEAHFAAQCPIIVDPKHFVVEQVIESLEERHRRRSLQRKALGTASRKAQVGSRTSTGGAFLTTIFGPLAAVPLVVRVLAPRLASRIRKKCAGFIAPPSETRLQLKRVAQDPGPQNGHVGFSTEEAAAIAGGALRLIGLTSQFARLVCFLGHGSTSMNNPHQAAYDCGACGGAPGAPNARAIAQMLNDPAIREILSAQGVRIPSDTIFVGGCHNTCDESVELFDLDLVPESHQGDLHEAIRLFDEVGDRSAHERCRRFSSARLDLSFPEARRHVQARAEDLAQTRPELGHATNALFFVGRRDRTRGLFFDRRAFFISYDPTQDDPSSSTLGRILGPAIPVSLGINLEYFFSRMDNSGWGCGTKLPHNVSSLVGVMDGSTSDLRPGLPWQTVEIHEPMRLLVVIETTPAKMEGLLAASSELQKHVGNGWVQLALLDPDSNRIWTCHNGKFASYEPESKEIDAVDSSVDWYRGWRDHLGFALIRNSMKPIVDVDASDSARGHR